MTTPLSESKIRKLIGKKISWNAEAAPGNSRYQGICIIISVSEDTRFPLKTKTLSGDDLSLAFLDGHGLCSADGGKSYKVTNEDYCYSYSDSYREVFFSIIDNEN